MDHKGLSKVERQLLLREKVTALAVQAKRGSVAALFASIMLGVLFVTTEDVGLSNTLIWMAFMVAAYTLRNWVVRKALREEQDLHRTESIIALSSATIGLVISSPAIFFMPHMEPIVRGLYIGLMVGWISSAVAIIGINFISYVLYVVIGMSYLLIGVWMTVPTIYASATTIGALVTSYMLISFSKQLSSLFEESVLIRWERDILVTQLTHSVAEAKSVQNERSRFLAAAAHDLKEPPHALLLWVNILENPSSEDEEKQAVIGIKKSAASIENMFIGLLDLARLDEGAILPTMSDVKLSIIIGSIETEYQIRCEEKGIEFAVNCPTDVLARADASLLERIIRNLVDNAVKYTSSGKIAISVEAMEEEVKIIVSDTGIGISEEDLDSIFDAFYRASSSVNTSVQGMGLGLSVAKQMAELMDGKIELNSRENEWTRACISLLASLPSDQSQSTRKAKIYRLPGRILVIEDNEAARNALQAWLKNNGIISVCADSLGSAMEKMGKVDFEPEHALVDFHLGPNSNGIEVIRKLRETFPKLPATIVTGALLEADVVEDNVLVLRKPLKPERLREALSR